MLIGISGKIKSGKDAIADIFMADFGRMVVEEDFILLRDILSRIN